MSSKAIRMEKGSKLKRQKPNEVIYLVEEEKDRFSVLPNSVAQFIFSFLAIEDIARLSLTSKRCKELCLSVRKLIIDASQIKSTTSYSTQRVQFMDFLVNFIANHRNTELTSLTIRWSDVDVYHNETFRIVSMLDNAVRCRVNEVDLTLSVDHDGVFVIPLELFYCESLTSLKVDMNYGKLELPYPYGFAHLECLHLNVATIVNADFGKWISSFCKNLKKLYLKQLSGIGNLKIASSSLKHIDIEKCDLEHLDISSESLESICIKQSSWRKSPLNICAPNVLSLWLDISSTNICSLGKMNLLHESTLLFFSPVNDRPRSTSPGLLSSLSQTRHFVINCECIKVLCDKYTECLPFAFDNLQTLELQHSFLTDSFIPSMATFLQKMQLSVKSLHIKPFEGCKRIKEWSYMNASGFAENFWEEQNILFLGGLEEFKIDICGGNNEEALVECILNNATKLKKVVILCGSSMPTKISAKMISATLASGANFRSEEGMMVLELKPQT